jgi:hypothetical protein
VIEVPVDRLWKLVEPTLFLPAGQLRGNADITGILVENDHCDGASLSLSGCRSMTSS